MGFWNTLGNVLVGAARGAQNWTEEANKYYEKYRFLDRETLLEKYRRASSTAEKAGIAKVMKENGWTANA